MGISSKSELQEKYQEIGQLLVSAQWKHWVEFLNGRKVHFQKQVNAAVENGNLEQAKIAKALMDDSMEQIQLFLQKHKELGQQIRGNK